MQLLKKYPNRRIYHMGKSCYITLADVRKMVVSRETFQVVDSKTGQDLTRSVLLQIISEMEAEGHQSVLTNRVLEELIRFYGDRLVGAVGPFLERQIVGFLSQQDKIREQLFAITKGKQALKSLPEIPGQNALIDALSKQYQQLLKPFGKSVKKKAVKEKTIQAKQVKKVTKKKASDKSENNEPMGE